MTTRGPGPLAINHQEGCTARPHETRHREVTAPSEDGYLYLKVWDECLRCGRRAIEQIDLALVRGPQPKKRTWSSLEVPPDPPAA